MTNIPALVSWHAPEYPANDNDDAGSQESVRAMNAAPEKRNNRIPRGRTVLPVKARRRVPGGACCVLPNFPRCLTLWEVGTLYVVSRLRAWNCLVGSSKWWSMSSRAGRTAGTTCTRRRPGTATCGRPSCMSRGGVPRSVAPLLVAPWPHWRRCCYDRIRVRRGHNAHVLLLIRARLRSIQGGHAERLDVRERAIAASWGFAVILLRAVSPRFAPLRITPDACTVLTNCGLRYTMRNKSPLLQIPLRAVEQPRAEERPSPHTALY